MHIALIHSRLTYYGGLETRLFNYMNYFIGKGFKVTVIVYKADKNIKVPQGAELIKLNVRWIPRQIRNVFFNFCLGKYMKRHKFDFSLSLGRTSHQEAVLAPGNHKGYMRALNKTGKSLNDRLQIYLDRVSYEKSRLIFACSDLIKSELIELYNIPENKIHVLFPPLNVQNFNNSLRSQRDALRQEFGMKSNVKAFVFVSSGHKRKGIDLLLEVFKSLDPELFELYIAGKPKVETNLKNITSLGFVAKPQRLFTAADYTIHPAQFEPFGQIVPESLACGTPVIISSMVGAKEILNTGEGLVIDSFDPAEWLDKIQNIENYNLKVAPDFAAYSKLSLENHIHLMMQYKEANK